jgi:hypothetical protein
VFGSDWLTEMKDDLDQIGHPTAEQLDLLSRCVGFIDRQLPDQGPLWRTCRFADDCWRHDTGERPCPMSVRIPFVGPAYPERRIAVVAINSRDDGHAGDEIAATRKVIARLSEGHRDYGTRSYFHYWVAAAVRAALAGITGAEIEPRPTPQDAAAALPSSARLQAVQCSPTGTSRRTPTREMTQHCPGFLLRAQLEILAPSVLLMFGHAAHQAIEQPRMDIEWDTRWADSGGCFSRGRTEFQRRAMTVVAFHHPSARTWSRSWDAYTQSLVDRPLA